MAQDTPIHIKLPENATPGQYEITLRQAAATAPERERKQIQLSGTISAPADFLAVKRDRTDVYDPLRSHVIVSSKDQSITLVLNDNDALGDTVTGKLTINPLLTALGLNKGQGRDNRQMVKLLKDYRPYYAAGNAVAFDDLVGKFQRFVAQITKERKDIKEGSGSSDRGVTTTVANGADFNIEFMLELPLYQGENKTCFRIAIEVEESDADVRFILESPEAQLLLLDQADALLTQHVAPIRSWGCPVIHKD